MKASKFSELIWYREYLHLKDVFSIVREIVIRYSLFELHQRPILSLLARTFIIHFFMGLSESIDIELKILNIELQD